MKYTPRRSSYWLSALLLATLFLAFFGCKKYPNPPQLTAKGSLVSDYYVNCYPFDVHGTYYNGIPADDTNYVEISVRVTKPGSYKITTDQQFGVSFSASGIFSDTGMNLVHLKPTGAFTQFRQVADFHTYFDSSTCGFSIWITDSAARTLPDNTWQLTAGGKVYQGPISGKTTLNPGGGIYFEYYGSMQGYTDTSLTIVYLQSIYDSVNTCSRPTTTSTSIKFVSSRFAPGAAITLTANSSTAQQGAILDLNSCNSNVIWSFNGTALDAAGNMVPITHARMRCSNLNSVYFPG